MRAFVCIGLVAIVAALASIGPQLRRASAAKGELTTPSVALPADYPEADRDRVNRVLASDKVEFVGGGWLNFLTRLDYRGDTEALNTFIGEMIECRGVSILVRFTQGGDSCLDGGLDWSISHWAGQNEFQVTVNLDSKRIDLTALRLPDMHGPAE